MLKKWKHLPFERYADDIIVHCRAVGSKPSTCRVENRLRECGLELHSEKTKLVYCKDSNRPESHPHEKFDFLGFTFRPRKANTRRGGLFCSFIRPSRTTQLGKSVMRSADGNCIFVPQNHRGLAQEINPKLRGWSTTTVASFLRRSGPSRGMSANRWFAGLVANTRRCFIIARVRGRGCFG